MDSAVILGYAMPMIKTLLMLVFGLGGVVGVGYFFFIVKRRKAWICHVHEQKADGRLHLVSIDKIIEKKINKGKQRIYMMRKAKTEVIPPPWECTDRLFGKEYVNYLRIEDEFIPMQKDMDNFDYAISKGDKEKKKSFIKRFKERLHQIKSKEKKEVEDRYIYIPINQALVANMTYKPLEYDINMMRINALDNRDKIYKDKQDWLQKYGTFLAFGMIIVLIIVVLYLSYDYSANVLNQAMGKAGETLSMVQELASKLGGGSPPS